MGKFKEMAISEELPYWEFPEGPLPHALLTDGSLSAGLKVGVIDIECFDGQEVNSLTTQLRTLLNSLSEGSKLQFFLNIDSDFKELLSKHEGQLVDSAPEIIKELSQSRFKKLRDQTDNRELYRPQLYVFMTLKAKESSGFSVFKKEEEFVQISAEKYDSTLEELKQQIESLKSSLESSGMQTQILSREELIQVAYRHLNPARSAALSPPSVFTPKDAQFDAELLKENPWLAVESPRSQLAFGDLVLNYDNFFLDGKVHKVITLKTLPEITFAGMIASFMRLPFHYDLILSMEVPPQTKEMEKLKTKRRMAHSMASGPSNQVSDLESESKLSSTEDLIRELINTGQKIFSFELSMILKTEPTKEGLRQLDLNCREVLSRLRTLNGAEGLTESVASWKLFKNNLPAAPKHQVRGKRVKTNNLADFLPVYGPRVGDETPCVLFHNRLNGLVSYNPFDFALPNFNSLVTGSSGAGKSFLNNFILLQEVARGTRAFIVDIGGSYRKLTEALGGQYVEINLSEDYAINPFFIPDPREKPSNQKLKSLLAIIETMVAEDDKSKLPKLDRVLLEKAILETYERLGQAGKIPLLSDLMATCKESSEPTLQIFSKLLFSWTGDRPYGKLLDRVGSLKTNSLITAFDLKGLSAYPDLQAVIILILTDFILTQVEQDKTSTKRVILDEAWELLKSPAAANFMEYCARTLRKTGSGITFITQGVEEIVSSAIGPAILNNTATKFVMLQRGDTKVLTEVLKLNPQELGLIQSLGQKKGFYSEGFMIEGDHRQVVRIYPQPLDYWLSTSDAKDNQYLDDVMKDEGLTLIQALKKASVYAPYGVAQLKAGRS